MGNNQLYSCQSSPTTRPLVGDWKHATEGNAQGVEVSGEAGNEV